VSRWAPTLALALLGVACTQTRFRVSPYDTDELRASALAARATDLCLAQRGGSQLPQHPFTSDGCSMWPDSTWVDCCVNHDIAYWCGGSAADRRRADDALRECVAERSSELMGILTWVGVIMGGIPWQPMPWRWGYGWSGLRGYEE